MMYLDSRKDYQTGKHYYSQATRRYSVYMAPGSTRRQQAYPKRHSENRTVAGRRAALERAMWDATPKLAKLIGEFVAATMRQPSHLEILMGRTDL